MSQLNQNEQGKNGVDMSAKDKAKELIEKFYDIQAKIEQDTTNENKKKAESFNNELGEDVDLFWRELAKQSALIAVDEMINWKENLFVTEGSMAYKYLIEVKEHIKNTQYGKSKKRRS